MDTWVKTSRSSSRRVKLGCFNPCFNGYMGKDPVRRSHTAVRRSVSILVLMDTWVKTPI